MPLANQMGKVFCHQHRHRDKTLYIIRTPSTFFSNRTQQTFIPVVANAIDGTLLGLLTKHAGSVRKGFALIIGLLQTGLFQANCCWCNGCGESLDAHYSSI